MPLGIRDRISNITKKYKEKQAAKYRKKEELDAIYEEEKARRMKVEVAKRAREAARESSKQKYPKHPKSPVGRVIGGLQTINRVAKAADPNRNPFVSHRKVKKKKSKSRHKSKRKTVRNHPPSLNWSPFGPSPGNPASSNDSFEAEGKRWMGDMRW